jgi:hypothetical protein
MCRSSTTSIGFLLLLWIGIVLPATEQQLTQLAEECRYGNSFGSMAVNDVEQHSDTAAGPAGHGYTMSPDLTDYNVSWPANPSIQVAHVSQASATVRLISRSLDPQERPPKRPAIGA